jgi:hypothetical protein
VERRSGTRDAAASWMCPAAADLAARRRVGAETRAETRETTSCTRALIAPVRSSQTVSVRARSVCSLRPRHCPRTFQCIETNVPTTGAGRGRFGVALCARSPPPPTPARRPCPVRGGIARDAASELRLARQRGADNCGPADDARTARRGADWRQRGSGTGAAKRSKRTAPPASIEVKSSQSRSN